MTSLLNQYSYVLISLGVVLSAVLVMRRRGMRRNRVTGIAILLVAALAAGWGALRPGASDVNNLNEAEAMIGNGRPTMIEFFSNYCLGCVGVKPTVDALVARVRDDLNVMRVDIHTDLGASLRERFRFSYTPEFLILDSDGQEVWRAHTPPSVDELARMLALPGLAS